MLVGTRDGKLDERTRVAVEDAMAVREDLSTRMIHVSHVGRGRTGCVCMVLPLQGSTMALQHVLHVCCRFRRMLWRWTASRSSHRGCACTWRRVWIACTQRAIKWRTRSRWECTGPHQSDPRRAGIAQHRKRRRTHSSSESRCSLGPRMCVACSTRSYGGRRRCVGLGRVAVEELCVAGCPRLSKSLCGALTAADGGVRR